jgi:hypothetical protein
MGPVHKSTVAAETGNREGCGTRCVRCSGSRERHRGFSADEQLGGSRVAVDVVCFAAPRSNQQSGMRLVPALAGSPCRPAPPQQDGIFAVAMNCSNRQPPPQSRNQALQSLQSLQSIPTLTLTPTSHSQ